MDAEAWNIRRLGHSDLNGCGDGMQLLLRDSYLYVGHLGRAGTSILDVSDPRAPRVVRQLPNPPHTHTHKVQIAGDLLAVTDEATEPECGGPPRRVRLVDIRDETRPRVVGMLPEPQGDFCTRGLRFGPHNLHENRPGSFISDRLLFVTYFNAGLRVVDIEDPERPSEVAFYIPPAPPGQRAIQTNDVFVAANGLIYISDRVHGGVEILELTL